MRNVWCDTICIQNMHNWRDSVILSFRAGEKLSSLPDGSGDNFPPVPSDNITGITRLGIFGI